MDIPEDLCCPIMGDILDDPISVPCCQVAFSRNSLVNWFQKNQNCPNCRKSLSTFNPATCPKNITIANIIDLFKTSDPLADLAKNIEVDHQWSCVYTPILNEHGVYDDVGELELSLEKSSFKPCPSLFIIAVDRSGSMSGHPWRQVESALIHILSLANINSTVRVVIIGYDSSAAIIDTTGTLNEQITVVKHMFTGGGTMFGAAFEKIQTVLQTYTYGGDSLEKNSVSNVNIVFMTDGQAGDTNKNNLAKHFSNMLKSTWSGPLCVHSVGFSQGCDRNLLEEIKEAGNISGTFRYAEPQDDDDALCMKLTSLFEIASKGSCINLKLTLTDDCRSISGENDLNIQFAVNEYRMGQYHCWVNGIAKGSSVIINTDLDNNVEIPIKINLKKSTEITHKWYNYQTDNLTREIINITKEKYSDDILSLHLAILLQKINKMFTLVTDENIICRLNYLQEQVYNLQSGKAINMSKLSDMQYASMFSAVVKKQNNNVVTTNNVVVRAINSQPEWRELPIRCYSKNNSGKSRNDLMEAICNLPYDIITDEIISLLESYNNINYQDVDGNTALLIASYCGFSKVVDEILNRFEVDLNYANKEGETAITIAIKKRGFDRIIRRLIKEGATITADRKDALLQFAVDHGYIRTSELIGSMGDVSNVITDRMTPDYIKFVYENVMEREMNFNINEYLRVALKKCMTEFVSILMEKHGGVVTIEMFLDSCIPPIPDCPEVEKYLELSKVVLAKFPELINMVDVNEEGVVFKSAEKGSLDHVKMFLDMGAEIDHKNNLGNTPLWVACSKRYPCIVHELIVRGADVNAVNEKGNPPIYGICQRGPLKVAEELLANGAMVDIVNKNGDTLVLMCCRNGQHDILKLFLNYVDEDFVNYRAPIDGFSTIFSSVESNRPECIKVLYEYGIDLNQQTDSDNKILPNATPLHLGAYYNSLQSVVKLLELGANPMIPDSNGQLPLHIAVIQNNIDIIRVLKDYGLNVCDVTKNTPMSYCRNDEVKKLLFNPGLTILTKLAKGYFSREDEELAIQIIKNTGVVGWFRTSDVLDIVDTMGYTPLYWAVVYSNYNIVKAFCDMGANTDICNMYNVSMVTWANWINNPRIKKYFNGECNINPSYRSTLFLGSKPKQNIVLDSTINNRMNSFTGVFPYVVENNCKEIMIPDIFKIVNVEGDIYIWYAKIMVTNLIASGCMNLNVHELFSLSLLMNNGIVMGLVNKAIQENNYGNMSNLINNINSGLDKVPPIECEVYFAVDSIDRNKFMKGMEINFNGYISSSTMWRVALGSVPEYESKRRGTVFIVKSRNGKYMSPYSMFSYDGEVIFKNPKFVVNNWYRGGDSIVLGQENIREHTYKIKEEEILDYVNSNRSLVIELVEKIDE